MAVKVLLCQRHHFHENLLQKGDLLLYGVADGVDFGLKEGLVDHFHANFGYIIRAAHIFPIPPLELASLQFLEPVFFLEVLLFEVGKREVYYSIALDDILQNSVDGELLASVDRKHLLVLDGLILVQQGF